jgi:hypothetical protein
MRGITPMTLIALTNCVMSTLGTAGIVASAVDEIAVDETWTSAV